MINNDKPFKTYEEQLNILFSRNIDINFSNNNFALSILEDFSYYTIINGYKEYYTIEDDYFKSGTTIEDIFTFYMLDTSLSHILLKYIIYIEQSLKTKLGYQIASKYGTNLKCYLTKDHYSHSKYTERTLRNLKRKSFDNKSIRIAHYQTNYNNVPPWILANEITFNDAIKWYIILNKKNKSAITRRMLFSTNIINSDMPFYKDFLTISLELLREFRNNIAHGKRNFKSNSNYSVKKDIFLKIIPEVLLEKNEYNFFCKHSNLYNVILIIFTLTNNRYMLSSFFIELISLLENYKHGYSNININIYEFLNLPIDLKDRLSIAIDEKILILNEKQR